MATKQAHFVPQTYLRGFLFDEKKEKVYAYNSRSKLITPTRIDKICSQNYLYRVKDKDDNDSDEIEEMLAKDIEPKYQGWLDAVRSGKWLDNSTIADISVFIALQHLRVPSTMAFFEEMGVNALRNAAKDELLKLLDDDARKAMMDEFKRDDPARFEKLLKENPDFTGELSKQDIQDMIDENNMKLTVDIGKNNVIRGIFEQVLPIADTFIRRGWHIMFAPDGYEFITSDMPAFVAKRMPDGVIHFSFGGFGRLDSEIVFPMAKDVCIVINGPEYFQKAGVVTPAAVDIINRMVSSRPNLQYLISAQQSLVERYSRYLSSPPQMQE